MLPAVSLLLLLASCTKEVNKVFLESSSPVTLSSSATVINLSFANAQKEVVRLSWNNPDYTFTTGVSSQDVTYRVELDTTGANFTNPNKKVFSISKDLSLSLTDSALNDAMLNQLELKKDMPHNIELRVIASLVNNAAPIVSNVIKFTNVVPYAIPPKVAVPASGKLFMIGSATPGGWDNPVPADHELTRIDDNIFEITINLTGGGSYLLLPVNGSWDDKYGFTGGNNENNPDGDDFKRGGGDLLAPAASGRYKVTLDFQRGKFTVVKQ